MPGTSPDVTRTGWAIIGAVVLAVLVVLRHVIEAGLGKYVLRLLSQEKDAVREFVAFDLFAERIATVDDAVDMVNRHEDVIQGVTASLLAQGTEIAVINRQTHGLEELPRALNNLAKSVETITLAFARMEEREKMRDHWDGQTERRSRDRRDQ